MSRTNLTPEQARAIIRDPNSEAKMKPTSGWCGGYLQANVVLLPSHVADQFRGFCDANPQACPLLYQSKPGELTAGVLAQSSDIRTDLPGYRIYKEGKLENETSNIMTYWRDDLVAFYLGCSFTFESALIKNNVPVRNIEQKRNVPMFITNIACEKSGIFHTNLVVSMRPMPEDRVAVADAVTSPLLLSHGGVVYSGDATKIGIFDTSAPDFGESVVFQENDIPVFWACGVTGIMAGVSACTDLLVTHSPGCMFICDVIADEIIRPNANINDFPRAIEDHFIGAHSALMQAARSVHVASSIILDFGDVVSAEEIQEIVALLRWENLETLVLDENSKVSSSLLIVVGQSSKQNDSSTIYIDIQESPRSNAIITATYVLGAQLLYEAVNVLTKVVTAS